MKNNITLKEETGTNLVIPAKTLLVFIDDTGHELLTDKSVPFFGFTGCACMVEDYEKQVREPWEIVESAFKPSALPLHATDIGKKNNTTTEQYNAINNFFSTTQFGRFACVISDKTLNSSPYSYLALVAAELYKKLEAIMKWLSFEKVMYVIEDTEDIERKEQITKAFSGYTLTEIDKNKEIPTEHFFMPKKSNESGLIVADFIAHTAGTTVRDKRRGKIKNFIERPDFKNVFFTLDEKWISFISVDSITSSSA